jgi:hypothetical protein
VACEDTGHSSDKADECHHPADNDCSVYSNGNSGCGVNDTTSVSYGAPFARNGGGVWATEFAASGISVWFFPRPSVPANLQNSSMIPDPSTWGTPSAYFSNSTCSIGDYFGDQQLVVDITLCGDWAGSSAVFEQTCSGTCTDLVADPTNYNNAYFELKSVRVYTDTDAAGSSTTAATATAVSPAKASSTSTRTSATASAVKGVCSVRASSTSSAGRIASSSVLVSVAAALGWSLLF